jgi:hypothetical protein
MVATERCSRRWSAAGELGQQLVLQALGRQLDRRQRVLDLVRQAARHLAQAALRCADTTSVMSSNTSSRARPAARHRAPAGSAARRRRAAAARGLTVSMRPVCGPAR